MPRLGGDTVEREEAGRGVERFDEILVTDDDVPYVAAPELAGLDEDDRTRVSAELKPYEEARRRAKLRGTQTVYD